MKKYLLSIFGGLFLMFSAQAQTQFQLVQASPNHTILEAAIEATNLDGVFNGGGPISLLAPDDDAFNALPDGLLDLLLTDPSTSGVLYDVLINHGVVPDAGPSDLVDGATLNTLTGQQLAVTNDGTTITVDGATITQSAAASNGILHVIDAVLVRPSATTVYDYIAESDDHTTLEAAVNAAGLDVALQTSPALTVFAPTDAAFAALPEGLVTALLTDPEGLLADILLYHVADGIAASTSLSQDQMVTTLQGEDVVIDLVGGVFINGAEVTVADIPTINGVVHVIDAVLVPADVPTVVDIVVESPDHNTLEAAVIAAELADDLTAPGQVFTVFAPTDAAFDLLPAGLVEALLTDPTGILANILLQHVLGSIETSGDLGDGDMFTTLLGQDITVSNDGTTISVNGAVVSVANIPAINGIVHVIDAVIIPADQTTVYDIIEGSPDHTTLELALMEAELDDDLQDGTALTVFAPTDDAFNNLPDGLVANLLLDPTGTLADILLYHVVDGIALSTSLTDGQTIATLFNGEEVTVSTTGGVFINGAEVTVADIPTINGVVHVIDAVLTEAAPTVLDVVVNSPDHNTLEIAVVAAELDGALNDGEALTVFAPTDAAFDLLPQNLVATLLTDPTGILANILQQHVVGSAEYAADLTDGTVLQSLLGQDLTIGDDGTTLTVNGVTVTVANIVAVNGVVHVIDAVIIPADQPTVLDIVTESTDHNTLEIAVLAAGLDGALADGDALTVFAPTDAAFDLLPANLVNALLTDPTGVLTQVLTYHVVGSIANSESLVDGPVETLFMEDVTISTMPAVTVNGVTVSVADIPAINGVVHVIDAVLVPEGATTVVDIVIDSPDHGILEQSVIDAGLVDALAGDAGPITLFAPTDAAFGLVDPDDLAEIVADPDGLLTDVLLYHVINGIVLAEDVTTGDVPTLFGETISIDASAGVVINGNSTVEVTNLVGINGVVHVVDAVLIPTTLSVDDIDAVESFNAFPNPSNDVLNIEIDLVSSERLTVDFVNMIGQVVKSVDFGQRSTGLNREVIDMNDMAQGFYLMNVTIGQSQLTYKIQVAK